MKLLFRAIFLLLMTLVVAACGTAATPVFEAPDEEAIIEADSHSAEEEGVEVAVQPTETPIPPTATLEPPTPTVEPPTATPTEEPTAAPSDPIARLIASRDPVNGEALFGTQYDTNMGPFACSTCHYVDSNERLIGPGLLNIKDIAADREEGVIAERYLYNSIVDPNEYLVEGFVEGVMPQNWHDLMSDPEIYDIIAYLLTLEGEE